MNIWYYLFNSYGLEIEKYAQKIKYVQHACPLWVPLIENEKQCLIEEIIKNDHYDFTSKVPNIDTLVLACTHPILKPILNDFLPKNIMFCLRTNCCEKTSRIP